MKKLGLNEDFICRIWEDKSFYTSLKTCNGESVEILNHGTKNPDAGPDYKDAKVKIDGKIYTGSIEIHRSVKDWYAHNHKGDNKYNDLILHVAFYENDEGENYADPKVRKARSIPNVILSKFLSRSVHEIWKEIINKPSPEFKLPCYPDNSSVALPLKNEWIIALSRERLNFKTARLKSQIESLSTEIKKKILWEQVMFEFICEALGYSKNKEAFLRLSRMVELDIIKKKNLSLTEIDALLFGLSGFLYDLSFKDWYITQLKTNWQRLKDELKAGQMDKSEWSFFRLRPSNFPTLRIAYASGLLHDLLNNNLFKDIIRIFESGNNIKKSLLKRFLEIQISEYWHHHYNFGKLASNELNSIGKERITDIIVNVIVPLVSLYAELFDKVNLKSRVEYFYKKEKQKSGANEVIRVMEKQLCLKVNTMSGEQGLLQLHNFYCVKGKCGTCEIGKTVFANEKVNEPLRIILY